MRRITVVLLTALLTAGTVFAQELTVSGEIKTGFYMEQETIGELDSVARGGMRNTDGDSGAGEGRIRMDFRFIYENMGLRIRFQIDPQGVGGAFYPTWNFAYAYGNLFDDQLTISAGILGDSPWGTGGPELRRELETRESTRKSEMSGEIFTVDEGLMGIRFEYKPSFLPGLNLGFALNQPDQKPIKVEDQTFGDVFRETVVGAAYEHDLFAVSLGYRFDGEADQDTSTNKEEGGRLAYRLEERVLRNLMDGMRVWLNGYYYGIGCEQYVVPVSKGIGKKMGSGEYFINWLYWFWETENFVAKFDTCLGIYQTYFNLGSTPYSREEYQSLEFLPAFYYKFFDNLLQAGLRLGFGMEFGSGKTYKDSSYQYIFVEPQIRLNISSNAYIAAVYNFTDKYAWWKQNVGVPVDGVKEGDKSVKHSINIRAVYTF